MFDNIIAKAQQAIKWLYILTAVFIVLLIVGLVLLFGYGWYGTGLLLIILFGALSFVFTIITLKVNFAKNRINSIPLVGKII